jgi:hypothetical protein
LLDDRLGVGDRLHLPRFEHRIVPAGHTLVEP